MPITKKNHRVFHRSLYAGELQSITLYKRGPDQQQGAIVTYTLYQCRRSIITKAGEPILGDMASAHRVFWHIPRIELDRVGVAYISAADKIYDPVENITYQPESTQTIMMKLFSNMIKVECVRLL